MDEPIQNALQLRQLAEYAASLRNNHWKVVSRKVLKGDQLAVVPPGTVIPSDPVLDLKTNAQRPDRKVPAVTIQAPGGKALPLKEYDAVFWSEAAVEKFVLPYYASKSMWMAAHVLHKLSMLWYGHVPGAAPRPDDPRPPADAAHPVPFAIAHLPTSDYVGLSSLASELYALYEGQDGTTLAVSLGDYLNDEEEAPAGF